MTEKPNDDVSKHGVSEEKIWKSFAEMLRGYLCKPFSGLSPV
jgi:hypothetical protein